jgi:hypothetical protein
MAGMTLYRSFDVYKRTDTGLVRYRCFQTTPGGFYCVQSSDFIQNRTFDKSLDDQFIELLSEEAPDKRSSAFPTIEEAIAHHDSEFADS